MTTVYTVPDSPADPEAAALKLIVRLPADILHTPAFTEVLQDYCGVLHAEGAFTGLSWADAKAIAAAVSFDVCSRDEAADEVDGLTGHNERQSVRHPAWAAGRLEFAS